MKRTDIKPGTAYAVHSGRHLLHRPLGERPNLVCVRFPDPLEATTVSRGNGKVTYLHGVTDDGRKVDVETRMVLATWGEYEAARTEREAQIEAATEAWLRREAAKEALLVAAEKRKEQWAQVRAMVPNLDTYTDLYLRKVDPAVLLAILHAAIDHATTKETP